MRYIDIGPMPQRTVDPGLPITLGAAAGELQAILKDLQACADGLTGGSTFLDWQGYAADAHQEYIADIVGAIESAIGQLGGAAASVQHDTEQSGITVANETQAIQNWEYARAHSRY